MAQTGIMIYASRFRFYGSQCLLEIQYFCLFIIFFPFRQPIIWFYTVFILFDFVAFRILHFYCIRRQFEMMYIISNMSLYCRTLWRMIVKGGPRNRSSEWLFNILLRVKFDLDFHPRISEKMLALELESNPENAIINWIGILCFYGVFHFCWG